jgi:hydrogenase-4 component B
MKVLLPLLPLVTLLAALCLFHARALRPAFLGGATAGAVIAIALALGMGPGSLELSWLLLGSTFGLDSLGRVLLGLAGILWLAAALGSLPLLSGEHGRRYAACFLLTMSGNMGLLVSQDIAGFYCWFALMTFAAYGLVLHDGTGEARRAGRAYLVLAVAGELLLVAGLFTLAAQAGNPTVAELPAVYGELPHPGVTAVLILAGFAVKMGVVPLHVWLPLAHPAAPVPASAVLSGVMLKAGLIGWVRLLPAESMNLPQPGLVLAALGLAAAFLAALVGCLQERPKTVLAYSSVSQMGLLALLVGLLLADFGEREVMLAAIGLFAMHHGLAKGALFLAVPVLKAGHRATALLSLLPAVALVGAPLTSGAAAKAVLKDAVPDSLVLWVSLTSVTTGLIMIRFLVLTWPRGKPHDLPGPTILIAWLAVLAASLLVPWLLAGGAWLDYTLQAGSLLDALWPLAASVVLALLAGAWRGRWPLIAEGDLLVPVERGLVRLRDLARSLLPAADSDAETPSWPRERGPLNEPRLAVAVLLLLGLALVLSALAGLTASG